MELSCKGARFKLRELHERRKRSNACIFECVFVRLWQEKLSLMPRLGVLGIDPCVVLDYK